MGAFPSTQRTEPEKPLDSHTVNNTAQQPHKEHVQKPRQQHEVQQQRSKVIQQPLHQRNVISTSDVNVLSERAIELRTRRVNLASFLAVSLFFTGMFANQLYRYYKNKDKFDEQLKQVYLEEARARVWLREQEKAEGNMNNNNSKFYCRNSFLINRNVRFILGPISSFVFGILCRQNF